MGLIGVDFGEVDVVVGPFNKLKQTMRKVFHDIKYKNKKQNVVHPAPIDMDKPVFIRIEYFNRATTFEVQRSDSCKFLYDNAAACLQIMGPFWAQQPFYLSWHTHTISPTASILDVFGGEISAKITLCIPCLVGGSKKAMNKSQIKSHADKQGNLKSFGNDKYIFVPTYSHIKECEDQILNTFKLQSESVDESKDIQTMGIIIEHLNNITPYVDNDKKNIIAWFVTQIEKLMSVHHWFTKCTSYTDYMVLMTTAYHTFTGKSVTNKFLEITNIFKSQSEEDFGDILKTLRQGFNNISSVDENPYVKRIVNMYSYLLVHGFLQRFGLDLNDDDYSKMERKMYIIKYSSKKDMFLCVCETTLFICEKIYEFKLTGDINIWGNNAANYEQWFETSDKLICLAPYTTNLEPHGMSYFEYISELKDMIEKGNSYIKFIEKNTGYEYTNMNRKLMSLKMIESAELTRRSAMKERKAPFGVLVHGTSSVAKSTFTKMLYYYYGALHKLKNDDHYRYVRNPADEYWSNFDTSKWCIQLDDIAFLHPGKASEADPTLMELLNVVNNVPYVPPQAALEDKGRTPVIAQLVVATTNASDLNAHEYFWCPLAIRRRLPFVVEVRPKTEYLHENGRFIDPLKLYSIDGEFPDYWIITVSKIVPFFDGQRDLAKLEIVKEFDDVNQFLKYFGEASLQHMDNQNKSSTCDVEMKSLKVCPICKLVVKYCNCSIDLQSGNNFNMMIRIITFLQACLNGMWWRFWFSVASIDLFIKFNIWMGRYKLIRYLTSRYLVRVYDRCVFHRIQESFSNNICNNKSWLIFLSIFGIAVTFVRTFFKYNRIQESSTFDPQVSNEDRFEAIKKTLEKEQRNNVWYNSTTELSTFEVPASSLCIKNITDTQFRDIVDKNMCRVYIVYSSQGVDKMRNTGGVVITNNIVMINNHALPTDQNELDVTIAFNLVTTGVNTNVTFKLYQSSIVRDLTHDLALFRLHSLPPRKSVLKYWGNIHERISRSLVLHRNKNGELTYHNDHNVSAYPNYYLAPLGINLNVYIAQSQVCTKDGDCGNLLVNMTPQGPIISGIHAFGNGNLAGYINIKKDHLETLLNKVLNNDFMSFDIQGGGSPNMELDGNKIPLTSLHHKSVFRYLERGTAEIYGSINLPRAAPKSSVKLTPLHAEMSKHFNFDINYGKPVMNGWEPWRKNIVEMVQPPILIKNDILKLCVESFTQDILSSLPINWEKELFFLNKIESVNGMPGILFIDRINISSSMGFPWNTSKKKFVHSTLNANNPDEVTFDAAVWERYDKIIENYKNGKRSYPVFSAHLKDEAIHKDKIKIKKTRLFTGAPIDWSLVVRSRLLSFVRLVQKNKFVFEAGPGTVCQSTEWGDIYKYLTVFGENKMVAGDYGKFDKRMIADIILAAFQIIINIHRAAGFSQEELTQIACIGYDTAFSIVNVNGDIVGFYGTEPSGHPLTVIINSLVNSLYMRYAYLNLNPLKEVGTFKSNVNLFTYGDDNIMGISDNAPWFNHTNIQEEMSKIGVEYTMADKTSDSIPYINIQDCNFLKRKWVYDKDVGAYLCPLELNSIYKSLCIGVPSKTICPEEQMVNIISSANTEFFFHGKEFFEKHHLFLQQILSTEPYSAYVSQSTLPDWQTLKDRFWKASEQIANRM